MSNALRVDNEKELLRLHYAGQQIPSPNGGFLLLLGIRSAEDKSAIGIFECSATSMRYEIPVPKATRTERKKVKDAVEDGEDPDCPRHGAGYRLVRAGKDLVCMHCGIPYGRV